MKLAFFEPKEENRDSEFWETVVDFTKIKKDGVPIGDLLLYLRAFDSAFF